MTSIAPGTLGCLTSYFMCQIDLSSRLWGSSYRGRPARSFLPPRVPTPLPHLRPPGGSGEPGRGTSSWPPLAAAGRRPGEAPSSGSRVQCGPGPTGGRNALPRPPARRRPALPAPRRALCWPPCPAGADRAWAPLSPPRPRGCRVTLGLPSPEAALSRANGCGSLWEAGCHSRDAQPRASPRGGHRSLAAHPPGVLPVRVQRAPVLWMPVGRSWLTPDKVGCSSQPGQG